MAEDQSRNRAVFQARTPDGGFHTIYAMVCTERVPPEVATPEQLKKYVDAEYNTIPPRFKLISYSSELTAFDGIPAVRFRQIVSEAANRNTDKELKMTFSGYTVMTDPENRIALEIVFSERALLERLSDQPNPLEDEFFKAVHIDGKNANK